MKAFFSSLSNFLTAFLITSLIIAAFVAIAFLGEDDKALYFDSENEILYFFGNTYAPSQKFLTVCNTLFDFNSVFLGKHGVDVLRNIINVPLDYLKNTIGLLYGMFDVIINNSV